MEWLKGIAARFASGEKKVIALTLVAGVIIVIIVSKTLEYLGM